MSAGYAQDAPLDTLALRQFLEAQMQRDGVHGLAISVVQGGAVAYQAGFGRDAEGPITAARPFVIGSLSKAVTATAVLQLSRAGALDLDAPVQRYLPAFDPGGVGEDVTVRHLLNQRSGFVRCDGFAEPGPAGAVSVDLSFAPGTDFAYSNLNYMLLGQVVEAASGQPYGGYVQQRLFQPLGMTASSAHPGERSLGIVQGRQYWYWPTAPMGVATVAPVTIPAGFIRASAADLARFHQAHLRADTTAGIGLTAEDFALLHTPPGGGDYGYAMGWVRGTWTGTPSLQHAGLTASHSSIMVLLPELATSVVILTDVNSFTAKDHLMDGTLRLLRGQPLPTYRRTGRWLRLVVLGGVLFGAIGFGRRIRQWHRAGYPTTLDTSAGGWLRLGGGLAVHAALLLGIPWYMDVPLAQMPHLQPDLGYGLMIGVGLGVLDTVVQGLLRGQ